MENLLISNILDTDSYKFSHWVQYPPKTTYMFSYLESRGGRYDSTVFFGLQYYLKRYLSKPVTMKQVEEAKEFAAAHGVPFNYEGWKYIATELQGRLPIRIRAVREGSIVPTHNILMSVESTDPKAFWVVSWVETMLVRLWYPITVATQSYQIRKIIKGYLDKTSDAPDAEIGFKLHDFGSRGVSSQESAMIGGAAHLINFMGSDTVAGVYMANKFYNEKMSGFSIPAAEHSTMTMWGKENEAAAYRNMLEKYKGQPIIAVVSDSYDIFNAAENIWGKELKAEVQGFKGTVVIRPDSGEPTEVVLKLLGILDNRFGSTFNKKGYKVLNNVRIIQGDGVNEGSIGDILETVVKHGYSASNVAFGMGGALLQKLDRDTQKFAFKCSAAEIDGQLVEVYKQPVTDKVKKSKRGKLDLAMMGRTGNEVITIPYPASLSAMDVVFEDGEILVEHNFADIRHRASLPPMVQYRGWVDRRVD